MKITAEELIHGSTISSRDGADYFSIEEEFFIDESVATNTIQAGSQF